MQKKVLKLTIKTIFHDYPDKALLLAVKKRIEAVFGSAMFASPLRTNESGGAHFFADILLDPERLLLEGSEN